MTNREICKRLIDLRDNMIHGQDSANSMGELSCVLSATGKLIRDLILDLSAPEEDEEWLQHLDDEPNLTYAFKDVLRSYLETHGDCQGGGRKSRAQEGKTCKGGEVR